MSSPQGFILILALVGLFKGVQPQGYFGNSGNQVGAQVTVKVTPTLTVTVFDVQTTVINVQETRTVTRRQNIDVVNTVYVNVPVPFTQTVTRRSFVPVAGQAVTSNVKVNNIQVSITTQVVPAASTAEFFSTGVIFVTRTQQTKQYSYITHTKCDQIEIVTIPTFTNVVVTQTQFVQTTTYVYSTFTTTRVITGSPATTTRGY